MKERPYRKVRRKGTKGTDGPERDERGIGLGGVRMGGTESGPLS